MVVFSHFVSNKHSFKSSGNLLNLLLRCGTRAIWQGHPMSLELTRVGLLVELVNHYTTRGALSSGLIVVFERYTTTYVKKNKVDLVTGDTFLQAAPVYYIKKNKFSDTF